MKNNILLTLLAFFFTGAVVNAQCPVNEGCHDVDMDFQTAGNGADISHLPDWTYSHGSPSVSATGFWLWSHSNRGEGINYSGYNFQAGKTYTVCIVASTDTHDGTAPPAGATFNIVASNGPVGGFNTSTASSPIPANPVPSDVVASVPFGSYPIPGTGTYTYTFTATDNWTNLWFYPRNAGLPQVEIAISSIVICCIEPCDASFELCLRDFGNGQTGMIPTLINSANNTIVNMEVYENGVLVYSGLPIGYVGTAGNNYTICITARNNTTGELCKRCLDFCIREWYDAEPGDFEKTMEAPATQTMDHIDVVPEVFKDKPTIDDLHKVVITPNPTQGSVEVVLKGSKSTMKAIEVYDLNSKLVYSDNSIQEQSRKNLDLTKLNSGVYMVKITFADGSTKQEKIVLEK